MKIHLTSYIALFSLSLLAYSPASFSLSTDRDQPAEISSDEVDVDFNTGRRTFIGNVRFVQGTLRVKADRIDASYKDGKIIEATAYGNDQPAAFRQRPDDKDADVEGRGQTIVMNQVENTLTLKKNASLKQGFDVAKGSVIFYNMDDDTLKVRGNARGESGPKDPNSQSKTETDPFFNEPTKEIPDPKPAPKAPAVEQPAESSESSSDSSTENETASKTEEQTPVEAIIIEQSEEQPEEFILPGQSGGDDSDGESNGRSRLIIKPKS